MGSGVAGLTGLHALEDIKQDKGSVTIRSLRKEADPVQALLQKHSTVKGGSRPSDPARALDLTNSAKLTTHQLPPRAATTKGNATLSFKDFSLFSAC